MRIKLLVSVLTLLIMLTAMAPQVTAAGGARPNDQYRAYLQALYWAKELRQFSPYLCERTRNNLESLDGRERQDAFKRWKKGYVAKFKLVREEIVGDLAFIEGTGIGLEFGQLTPAKVRVEMIMENGTWKIKHQVWTGSISMPHR
ncbi:MAG: hypothetical protein KIT34_06920 [Cyanobacteria bacterium TGS_CYA1]|nr:hypothetical protein [Cyanobacteria bacterium TGS_CYA1]